MSVFSRLLPGLAKAMSDVIQDLNGEPLPLLVLLQAEEGVMVCCNMDQTDRIEALEQLLSEWKAEREKEARPVASVLPPAGLLQ